MSQITQISIHFFKTQCLERFIMNSNFLRSFFTAAILVASVLLTACAGTGGIQGQARLPVSIDGNMGSIVLSGQGSNGGGVQIAHAPQQHVRSPQQSNPCPQGIFRGYQGNRPVCELEPGQHQRPQQQQGSIVGSAQCPCVVTQWGKACGNAAQSHEYGNPRERLQCTR